jgi:uncharacterized repeat protein (TIGR01451 family)
MKKTYLSIVFLLTVIVLGYPIKSYADTGCQPIYGGGQTCATTGNIAVNKTVMNPQTNQFVDNLNINDPRYQPGSTVTFQIAVTNTGNSNISRVNVSDVFPQYITFNSGPGNFDNNTKTLAFEVDNLSINETRTSTISAKIVDGSQIPISQGSVVCVVNQATATNQGNNSQTGQDNAQFCIEKVATSSGFPTFPTTNITVTPSTGPETFGLISLIPTGIAGWFLRKKSLKEVDQEEVNK